MDAGLLVYLFGGASGVYRVVFALDVVNVSFFWNFGGTLVIRGVHSHIGFFSLLFVVEDVLLFGGLSCFNVLVTGGAAVAREVVYFDDWSYHCVFVTFVVVRRIFRTFSSGREHIADGSGHLSFGLDRE